LVQAEREIMGKGRILIVDDEEDILELVRFNLSKEGYDTTCVESGEKALKCAQKERFDLMVLDLMLPGLDGLEVTQMLKSNATTKNIPIVMLTAKGEEADVVAGLEMGADDYITKPFSPRILSARVKAVLRRKGNTEEESNDIIQVHELVIHPGRREVLLAGRPVELTYTEFQVLYYLAKRPGWVLTRSQIVDAVRGTDYPVTDRSVDVQIVGLRKKLDPYGDYIQTVRGVGYRFKENE
jgi:two-component system phosphate regulon response regulator PhoB